MPTQSLSGSGGESRTAARPAPRYCCASSALSSHAGNVAVTLSLCPSGSSFSGSVFTISIMPSSIHSQRGTAASPCFSVTCWEPRRKIGELVVYRLGLAAGKFKQFVTDVTQNREIADSASRPVNFGDPMWRLQPASISF